MSTRDSFGSSEPTLSQLLHVINTENEAMCAYDDYRAFVVPVPTPPQLRLIGSVQDSNGVPCAPTSSVYQELSPWSPLPAYQPTGVRVDEASVVDRKKYPCSICPASFGRKRNLRRHILRCHAGRSSRSPVTAHARCWQCGKTFSRTDSLRRHKKTHGHDQLPPLDPIPESGRNSEDAAAVSLPSSSASSLTPDSPRQSPSPVPGESAKEPRIRKCPVCKKTFSRGDNLRRHVKKLHPQHELQPSVGELTISDQSPATYQLFGLC